MNTKIITIYDVINCFPMANADWTGRQKGIYGNETTLEVNIESS